jgi:hypothetical protein
MSFAWIRVAVVEELTLARIEALRAGFDIGWLILRQRSLLCTQ